MGGECSVTMLYLIIKNQQYILFYTVSRNKSVMYVGLSLVLPGLYVKIHDVNRFKSTLQIEIVHQTS